MMGVFPFVSISQPNRTLQDTLISLAFSGSQKPSASSGVDKQLDPVG
jgi:hypothetical protein